MSYRDPSYATLSDAQLVQKLLGVRQSRKHYRGTLQSLFAPQETGEQQPERCAVARELVKRWLAEQMQERPVFSSPSAARDYLRLHFAGREYESFVVLHLDAQHRLIVAEELFRGTLTQTSVYPREVVKASLRRNAAAVMFAHNHPSGSTQPSQADELLTRSLRSALALVDVQTLDHFIVAGSNVLSFAERGLL